MKLSQQSHIRSLRWRQHGGAVDAAVVVVAEVKIVAAVVVVAVSPNPVAKVSLGDNKMVVKLSLGDKVHVLEVPNIPTYLPEINSGAGCIIGGVVEVISVQQQPLAHGKMFSLQSHNHNENSTSSAVTVLSIQN